MRKMNKNNKEEEYISSESRWIEIIHTYVVKTNKEANVVKEMVFDCLDMLPKLSVLGIDIIGWEVSESNQKDKIMIQLTSHPALTPSDFLRYKSPIFAVLSYIEETLGSTPFYKGKFTEKKYLSIMNSAKKSTSYELEKKNYENRLLYFVEVYAHIGDHLVINYPLQSLESLKSENPEMWDKLSFPMEKESSKLIEEDWKNSKIK